MSSRCIVLTKIPYGGVTMLMLDSTKLWVFPSEEVAERTLRDLGFDLSKFQIVPLRI